MRKYAHKIDKNQNEIVEGLREIPGMSVTILSRVGKGVPDLLCGYQKRNFLFEVKPDFRDSLTPDEQKFQRGWNGQVHVVCTWQQAWVIIRREIAWNSRQTPDTSETCAPA